MKNFSVPTNKYLFRFIISGLFVTFKCSLKSAYSYIKIMFIHALSGTFSRPVNNGQKM